MSSFAVMSVFTPDMHHSFYKLYSCYLWVVYGLDKNTTCTETTCMSEIYR